MQGRGIGRSRPVPPDPEDAEAAYQRALLVLNAAAQTRAALTGRLTRAGFAPEAADSACSRLAELGYLDDASFAAALAGRRQRGGRGNAVIAQELRRRGVPADLVAATVGELDSGVQAAIVAALARRLDARLPPEMPVKQRQQRVGAALQRRGHPTSVIVTALRGLGQ